MTEDRATAYRALLSQALFDGDFFAVRGRQGDKAIANRFYNLLPLIAELREADRGAKGTAMNDKDSAGIECGGCAPPVQVTTPNDAARPAPVEFDWPEYQWQGMGCGLEDRGITDRYEACQYGFQEGVARCAEMLQHHFHLYTAADYDALRADRDCWERQADDRLKDWAAMRAERDEFMQLALDAAHERNEQRARAEAAEAKVARLTAFAKHVRDTAFDFVNDGPRPQQHHMRELAWKADAALNEGGE